jgi:NAD(P)-dependent dehydrogenase (short-subunit alcohol dehydrogenase family)
MSNQNTLMNQLAPSARLRLENQVVVVTGGARGIGEGIVRRFVQEGARVVFSDLLNEKGKTLEEELGKNVAFYQADATSPSDTEALMTFAVDRLGSLDCVVNNAGAGGESGPIAGTSVEGFDRSIALLLRGPFLGIKYALPHMEGGTIINIASVGQFGRRLRRARVYRSEVWSRRINEIGGFGARRARDQGQCHLPRRNCHFHLGPSFSGFARRHGRANPRNCETLGGRG